MACPLDGFFNSYNMCVYVCAARWSPQMEVEFEGRTEMWRSSERCSCFIG